MQPTLRQAIALVAFLILTYGAGAIGGAASIDAGTFYAALVRPDWAPPGWLFGPVWTALYTMMAIAAWGVWRARGLQGARGPLTLFAVQLGFNSLWSWLFFVWNTGAGAFVGIVILWLLIVATLVAFWRIKVWTGVLLLPYLAWVSFATALTWSVWCANPGVLG